MIRGLLALLCLLPGSVLAQTMTLDLDGHDMPWEGGDYAPLQFQVRESDAPKEAFADGAIVAWKDGWVRVNGQVMVFGKQTVTFRLWEAKGCTYNPGGRKFPWPAASAQPMPGQWVVYVPVNMAVRVSKGDRVYPCLHAGDGTVDGNPAHTRLHVSMNGP